MKRTLLSALAILAIGSTALAQSKPSFAGKWKLIADSIAAEPNGNGRGGTGGFGESFTIVQDDKTLTVLSVYPVVGEYKAVYALDGSESKNPIAANGVTIDRISRVKWDGARLLISTPMIVTSRTDGMRSAVTVQILSLDASGNLTIEARSAPDGPMLSKASFKKN